MVLDDRLRARIERSHDARKKVTLPESGMFIGPCYPLAERYTADCRNPVDNVSAGHTL